MLLTSLLLASALAAEPSAELPHLTLQLSVADSAPPPASPDPSNFSFDLLPQDTQTPEQKAQAEALERALNTRRKVLELHQGFGIATTALLVATVVVGQLNYSDKFGGSNTGSFELAHDWLATAASLSFATAGLLALFAPVPVAKKSHGFDSITLHKWSMIAATAGYVAEIVLGIVSVSREGHLNQQGVAEAHLINGYATTAAVATGVGALFLP